MRDTTSSIKPHYAALDGLRGVAAIAVVIFHLYEVLIPDYTKSPVGHSYLAVDFFFCLSGFVIGYAYDGRMKSIGVKQFIINRLIRLQPLVLLGTALGLLGLFFDPFMAMPPVQEFGWGKVLLATLCSVFLLPSPILGRFGNVFPLNAPAWSLSMEYVVNLFYALVLVRLSKKMLLIFLAAAAAFIIGVAYLRGDISGGWGAANYGDGYARVLFSFIAGLVVYRFKWVLKNKIHFWVYAAVLCGVFTFPHSNKDWFTEMCFVILLFPLIVACGSGVVATGWTHRLCIFLGKLSYPLYMLHFWMIWILISYAAKNPGEAQLYKMSALIFAIAVVVAYVSMTYFDEPLRKRLTRMYQRSRGIKAE